MPKTIEIKEVDWTNPAQVLRAAAVDMEAILKHKEVTFDMDYFGGVEKGKVCAVCMAGAVLYERLGKPFNLQRGVYDNEVLWGEITDEQYGAMHALDMFRQGDVDAFCEGFNAPTPDHNTPKRFEGILDDDETGDLIHSAREFADALDAQKAGD